MSLLSLNSVRKGFVKVDGVIKKKWKELGVLDAKVLKDDVFLPDSMDLRNPKYIEINGVYFSGLMIVNYARKQETGWILRLLENTNGKIQEFL